VPLNSIVKLEKEYHCALEARVSNPVLEAHGTITRILQKINIFRFLLDVSSQREQFHTSAIS